MPMKKPYEFAYGFKSHCTSISERLSKLEGCLNSIRKNKMKKFPPFGNEFLPPSKKYHFDILPYCVSNKTERYMWLLS